MAPSHGTTRGTSPWATGRDGGCAAPTRRATWRAVTDRRGPSTVGQHPSPSQEGLSRLGTPPTEHRSRASWAAVIAGFALLVSALVITTASDSDARRDIHDRSLGAIAASIDAERERRIETAIASGLDKVGTPYEFGAEGPAKYDCSALVREAFADAGVELPRVSRQQFRHLASVGRGDIERGDLLFFEDPVGHVGIYLGDDQILHASRSQQEVEVRDVFWHSFTGAGRI